MLFEQSAGTLPRKIVRMSLSSGVSCALFNALSLCFPLSFVSFLLALFDPLGPCKLPRIKSLMSPDPMSMSSGSSSSSSELSSSSSPLPLSSASSSALRFVPLAVKLAFCPCIALIRSAARRAA